MRIAHLILAHRAPLQLARLVKRISHCDADIYIHLDKKAAVGPFRQALSHIPRCYFISKRENVHWSAYSMVKATVNAFQEIQATQFRYDFVNLMSGADYPLKSNEEIHQFFANNITWSFMSFEHRGSHWWEEAQTRFKRFYFNDVNFRGKYFFERMINRLIRPPRPPSGFEIVGRSQWMTLSYPHMVYLLEVLNQEKRIEKFFRFSWAPDEFIFQTILYNSPFRNQIINNNLRYIDWVSDYGASPKILMTADYEALIQSNKLYARKFDIDIDANILDLLDTR